MRKKTPALKVLNLNTPIVPFGAYLLRSKKPQLTNSKFFYFSGQIQRIMKNN